MTSAVLMDTSENPKNVFFCRWYAFGWESEVVATPGRGVEWLAGGDIPNPLF